MGNVRRIYVEKKEPYAVKARELKEEIESFLGINSVEQIRVSFAMMWKIFLRKCLREPAGRFFRAACGYFISGAD